MPQQTPFTRVMFWRRREAIPEKLPTETAPPPVDTGELDAAIEGAAAILRARARYTFNVGDEDASTAAATLERWATHLLVRSPPPTDPERDPAAGRDWRGAAEYVRARSKREQSWAQASLRDMRDAIFAFVESYDRTAAARGRQDQNLRQRLLLLNRAAESGSHEALKREAYQVAAAVTEALEEQHQIAQSHAGDLKARLDRLGQELEEVRKEGETDPLTKVANRRLFDVTLSRSLALGGVMERELTLLMVDIDHFKAINDKHGHPAGDRVLCATADALTRTFPRRSDLVARYGGEEFVVLLTDTGAANAGRLGHRLLECVRRLSVDGLRVTVSVGVAVAARGESSADFIARADRALYAAKHGGRDRVVEAMSLPRAA